MQIFLIFCCLFGLLTCVFSSPIRPSFRTFEDYLQHLDKNLQTSIVRLAPEIRPSEPVAGDGRDDAGQNSLTNSIGTGITVDQAVEEEKNNVTCCILGEIAGDKGFHCFAEFYAARIQLRNMNRAHNRKLGFYGRGQLPHYGERLMKTFEQCVAGHGLVFHRCCHLATLERREIDLRGAGGTGSTNGGSGFGDHNRKLVRIDGRFRKVSSEESISDSMSDQDSSSAAAASASSSSMED